MTCQTLFSSKNTKKISSLSSAELVQRVIRLINTPSVLKKKTGTISLETCKSYKQTRANALVCLSDLQMSWETFPVF